MGEVDNRLEVLFGYQYLKNPSWYLLSWAHEQRDGTDYKRPRVFKSQIDFKKWKYPIKEQDLINFVIESLREYKITKKFKECREVFKEVTNTIIKFHKVLETHKDINDFYQTARTRDGKEYGKRYVPPADYLEIQKKVFESKIRFETILKKAIVKIDIQSIAKKLDIPSNLVATVILHLATGGRRVDRMSPVNMVDVTIGEPKILFTSAATRNDFEQFMKDLKKDRVAFTRFKMKLPLPKRIKPYRHTFAGIDYIAINVYKGKLSATHHLMTQIDKLQSTLPGYRFKIHPGNTRNQTRDLTKNESEDFPSIEAMGVAKKRLKKKITPLSSPLIK